VGGNERGDNDKLRFASGMETERPAVRGGWGRRREANDTTELERLFVEEKYGRKGWDDGDDGDGMSMCTDGVECNRGHG
jgi:hypothetical protein